MATCVFHVEGEMGSRNEKERLRIQAVVDEAVQSAVESLRPRGWKKALHSLQESLSLGATAGIFVALLALTLTAGYYAFARLEAEAKFQTHTNDTLDSIDKRLTAIDDHLKHLDADVATLKLSKLLSAPIKKGSQLQAKDLVSAARKNDIRLPTDLVEETGKRFVDASAQTPQAWDAALEFVNYKSFVNSLPPTLPKLAESTRPADFQTRYRWNSPLSTPPQVSVVGRLPEQSAARFSPIGEDLNAGQAEGDAFIFAVGGVVGLDGMQYKNVAFINSVIVYDGEPTSLNNVYFINCTFQMKFEQRAKGLAVALLSDGPATTFKSS